MVKIITNKTVELDKMVYVLVQGIDEYYLGGGTKGRNTIRTLATTYNYVEFNQMVHKAIWIIFEDSDRWDAQYPTTSLAFITKNVHRIINKALKGMVLR